MIAISLAHFFFFFFFHLNLPLFWHGFHDLTHTLHSLNLDISSRDFNLVTRCICVFFKNRFVCVIIFYFILYISNLNH